MTVSCLKADCSIGDSFVQKILGSPHAPNWYVQAKLAIPSATFTALAAEENTANALQVNSADSNQDAVFVTADDTAGGSHTFGAGGKNWWTSEDPSNPVAEFTPDQWHIVLFGYDGTTMTVTIDDAELFSYALAFTNGHNLVDLTLGGFGANAVAGEIYYAKDVRAGTTAGASDLFFDDFSGGDLSKWTATTGNVTVVADPFPDAFVTYATTADLFRVIRINSPTAAQVIAAQGDLDTASIEINAEIDWADDHVDATTQQLELMKGVCIDRAADLWRHRESAAGILGIVDESIPTTPGRYSWARYVARLSVLKDQWGVA